MSHVNAELLQKEEKKTNQGGLTFLSSDAQRLTRRLLAAGGALSVLLDDFV